MQHNDYNNSEVTNTLQAADTAQPIHSVTFLSIGFFIWLLATLLIRNFGHLIFKADAPIFAFVLYLVTAIGIIFIAKSLFAWQNLNQSQYFQAAILLAVPGMILDSVVMVGFRTTFPNLGLSSDSGVASWLLWSYAFVLISGFIRQGDI